MPPGVSGRRTAPDAMDGDHHWYPTMEEFKDFKTYMEYLESQGAHEKGVALVHVSSFAYYSATFSKDIRKPKSPFFSSPKMREMLSCAQLLSLSEGSRRMDSSQVWIQFGGF